MYQKKSVGSQSCHDSLTAFPVILVNCSFSISGPLYQAESRQRVEVGNTREGVGRQNMTHHFEQTSVLGSKHWNLWGAEVTMRHLQCLTGRKFDSKASSKTQKRKRPVGFSKVPRGVETLYRGDCLFPFHRLSQRGVCSEALSEAAGQSSLQQGLDGISHQPSRVHIPPAMWQNQALHPPPKQSWQKWDWRYINYTGSLLSALGFFHVLATQQ